MSAHPATQRSFETGRVVARRDLPNGYFVLSLEMPRIAAAAAGRPGTFFMLSVRPPDGNCWDPLLPRPFTFLRVHPPSVELYGRVVGRGTALLSRARPGDTLTALGPLGNGFAPPADLSARPLLVAGGVGVAPFLHLAEAYRSGPRPILLYGGKTADDVHLVEEFEAAGVSVEIATEDGSRGTKGLVVALLGPHLERGTPVALYACGPEGMMEAVARLAAGRQCQVSLEARMGCGMGVCRGCAVKMADGRYSEICVEGPVREAAEVWRTGEG